MERLEYKIISGDVVENPFIVNGQRVIFDNATQEIMVVFANVTKDYAEKKMGIKLEVYNGQTA